MNSIIRFVLLSLAVIGLALLAPLSPALAQDDLAKLQVMLAKSMDGQPPLTEDDVRTYLRNVEPIYRLRLEPTRQAEVIREINYWDENRFAYVTTKMAVGMSLLLRSPGDARNASIPAFARPTKAELDLIKLYEDQLARAMESMQAKYAPNSPAS